MGKAKYVRCPLCGYNRSVRKYEDMRATFEWDLENFILIQVREGGGRGSGFHAVPEESLTIEEAKVVYPDVIEAIKEQCKKILEKLG